jgi:hypothetical protein
MIALLFISVIYSLPFLLIQFMPGKKSFCAFSILYLFLIIMGWYDLLTTEDKNNSGAVIIFAAGFLVLLSLGAIMGIIIKAIRIYVETKKPTSTFNSPIALTGLFIIPCILYIMSIFFKP